MIENIEKLYQETIMDYNNRKDLKYEIENPTFVSRGHNPSCGDDILIFLKIENNKVKDASFIGNACAISTASISMLIEDIRNKEIEEVKEILKDFFAMMTKEEYNGNEYILNDAILLKFVSNMPARIKCATLAWHTLDEILNK